MENPELFWITGEADYPFAIDVLRVKVAQNEQPKTIARFIVEAFLKGNNGVFNMLPIIKHYKVNEIVPPPLWGEVANYLAYYIALTQFNEYTELQFLMVCSCAQSYAAVKTAQYCKQENTTGVNDVLRLQSIVFPNATFEDCNQMAKDAATTLYKAIANFRSAMVGAREWIKANKGASEVVPTDFEQHELLVKKYLPLWKDIFNDVNKLPYFRKERACFNFYKIAPDNTQVINFVKSMLEDYFLTNKITLLSL